MSLSLTYICIYIYSVYDRPHNIRRRARRRGPARTHICYICTKRHHTQLQRTAAYWRPAVITQTQHTQQ